eukprot:g23715.t1
MSLQVQRSFSLASLSLYHLSFLVVLFFAVLGIRGTLQLPFGPFWAEVFLSRIITCGVSDAVSTDASASLRADTDEDHETESELETSERRTLSSARSKCKCERHIMQTSVRSMIVMYFVLAEADRIHWRVAEQEADKLQDDYQGSIGHSSCSERQDEVHIWNEIGDQGVKLRHAGVVQMAIPILALGPLLLLGIWDVGFYVFLFYAPDDRVTQLDWFNASMQAVSIIARLGFLTLLLRCSIDERYFMLSAMTKTVAPIWFFYGELSIYTQGSISSASRDLYHLSFVLVLFFAILGIRGTLKLPFGRVLTEVFLSRIIKCFEAFDEAFSSVTRLDRDREVLKTEADSFDSLSGTRSFGVQRSEPR